MIRSLTDRIIILITTVLMLATVSAVAGFSITDVKVLTGILLLVFFLFVSLLVGRPVYVFAVAFISAVSAASGFEEAVIAFPAIACWSFCIRGKPLHIKLTVPVCLILVTAFILRERSLLIIGLIILSSYISFNSLRTEEERESLLKKYDESRENAIRERRMRRSAVDRSENDIYLATLEERNRIAREIHDNVGHILTRAIVQMKAVTVINKDETLKPYLMSVDESINNAMTSIRKSVHELHDDSIDLSLGLNDLMKSLDPKFEAKLITSIESPTSSEFKKAVLGIVKEALTNINKYSNGDKVRVEVIENNTFWRIFIFDNGRCEVRDYTADGCGGSGIGIENIIQRAASINGTARVFSDEKGFTVLVTAKKET